MSDRVNLIPPLPVEMDAQLRRALAQILQNHAKQINWATGWDTTAISADAVVAHDFVTVDATAGAVTVSLMPAKDWRDREIRIKKISSNTNLVIVDANAEELIDGATVATVATAIYSTMRLVSDGTQWWKV